MITCCFAGCPSRVMQVESLAFPNGRPAVDAKEGDAAVAPVTVKNSLGLAMEVVYETGGCLAKLGGWMQLLAGVSFAPLWRQ